eukprot:scaffold8471_cov184-Amphora_coffeaeformis.AAC.1
MGKRDIFLRRSAFLLENATHNQGSPRRAASFGWRHTPWESLTHFVVCAREYRFGISIHDIGGGGYAGMQYYHTGTTIGFFQGGILGQASSQTRVERCARETRQAVSQNDTHLLWDFHKRVDGALDRDFTLGNEFHNGFRLARDASAVGKCLTHLLEQPENLAICQIKLFSLKRQRDLYLIFFVRLPNSGGGEEISSSHIKKALYIL